MNASPLPQITIFCSYAKDDTKAAKDLWSSLAKHLKTSRHYAWQLWTFEQQLLLGEDFDEQIQAALSQADIGLMALSPSFLESDYIMKEELPKFLTPATGKRVAPIMLKAVSKNADLHGLAARQIFGFHDPFWNDKTPAKRDAWALALADELHRLGDR